MAFCANCGAQMAEGTGFCGSCGAAVGGSAQTSAPANVSAPASSGLAPNVAGALAYITIIPAIIFLVMEPYNKDKFIKFHSLQCIFFTVAMFALSIVLIPVGFVLAFIPVLGWILDAILWFVFLVGSLGLGIFLIYKAYNGDKFMLPVIGKLADQQAAK